MLSTFRSFRPLLLIALLLAIAGGATMAFGASDVTTPRAIPYVTSNVATSLSQPAAIAIDDNGNIYVGENQLTTNGSALVKKIDAKTGQVTVFAGGVAKAAAGTSTCPNPDRTVPGGGNNVGDGCLATQAFFGGGNGGIRGLAVWNNYLYIEDLGNYYIHRVNLATNIIEWVGGGSTSATWSGDGPLTSTTPLFKPPTGFAVDPLNGNVYFGAGGTSAATVRMITSDATTCANAANGPFTAPCIITVVNYTGQTGSPTPAFACADPTATLTAKNATVYFPQGLAFDADRNLYIAENQCYAVRKLTKNPQTGIVDQNSTFTTLLGNNVKTGTNPSWYDTTASPAYFGPVRGLASAGGSDLYVSTSNAVYLYDSSTGWAHRILGDTPGACAANGTTPFIGCPAPWASINNGSYGSSMAVDKAGNLYVTDYGANTVVKLAIGTDFIGIAPERTTTVPTTQYVLLHGGVVTGATADEPFSATLTTDTVPKPGCNTYAAGDNGTDCVMAVTYSPAIIGPENGLLHIQATANKDIPLQGIGNPPIDPKVSLSADRSVCAVGAACDIVLTATVTPGDNPPSTGLTVAGDMSACNGGSATQAFEAGANNTFTYTCSLPTTAAADVTLGPAKVSDDQLRSISSDAVLVSVIETPVAQAQSITVTYNTAKNITLASTGSGVLTYTIVTPPAHGTLSGEAPVLTYTPDSNFAGSDSFTFKAANGIESAPATVSITVLPAAPVAASQSITVNYNTAQAITLSATGTGTLSYTIVRPPAHGALTGDAPALTYTPDSNYSGPDSFTFTSTDSDNQESAPATVSITVLSQVPIAEDQSVTVLYNTAKPITLAASGMGTLTYSIVSLPAHGTLSGSAPDVVYTPEPNYSGADTFTFKATSNGADSNTATVTINVLPAAPVATAQSVTVNSNTAKPITLSATGTGTLTYVIVSQPSHGTLSGAAPDVTYTPALNYAGSDAFTFKAMDTNGQESGPATVSINVLPSVPVATSQSVTVSYNTAKPITLSASGTGTLTYAVVSQPAHGTLSGAAPDLTYTPATDFTGTDSFTFKAINTNAQESAPATVSITVLPAAPVATAQSVTVNHNTPQTIVLAATGTGPLTYTVLTQPLNGTLSGTAPNLTYTPAADYGGSDSFTFKATDGVNQDSAPATVSISVLPSVPVAADQTVTVTYNTAKAITLAATGSGTLTYTIVAQPAHGTLSGTAPNLTYTPTASYAGADSFTFKANNGLESNVATVNITVLPAAPVGTAQSVTVSYNTAKSITLAATGTGTLTFTVLTQPTHGALTGTAPNLTYTPSSNYIGTDSFTFKAGDTNNQQSAAATVSITVNGDLTWAAATGGSQSVSIAAGQTAEYKLQISGWTGATGTINFSCAGAPAGSFCTLSPYVASLTGTTPVPVTVWIKTNGSASGAAGTVMPTGNGPSNGSPWGVAFAFSAVAAALLTMKQKKMQWRVAGTCAALIMVVALSACGGKAKESQSSSSGTPAGTYTVTVTATSGSVTKTTELTLTVQ